MDRTNLTSRSQEQAGEAGAEVERVTCCIVGGGPAGAMLGLLLAREGIDVLVLEKHADFLRDFRGDTIHPSTLQIMSELGLAERLLQLPHAKVPLLQAQIGQDLVTIADFRLLQTRWPYIMLLPQWDFLDFITSEARRYANFHLHMQAEGLELIEEGDSICGVRYRSAEGLREVRALLTVAADGRSSRIRAQAGLVPLESATPMDVLWFRLSRDESDPESAMGIIGAGRFLALINRGDYWQIAYAIPKGAFERVRAAGLERFKESLRELIPGYADRLAELQDWEQVKLLVVQANRLPRWYRPGLLCIGDAAHAMSPAGGVGINLAIQDAVVAANILAGPLAAGCVSVRDLAEVQRQREWPTRIIQKLQSLAQQRATATVLHTTRPPRLPAYVKALLRLSLVRGLLARLIGFGVRRVHVR